MRLLAGAVCVGDDDRAKSICGVVCRSVGGDWKWQISLAPGVCFATASIANHPTKQQTWPPPLRYARTVAGSLRIDNRAELASLLGWTPADALLVSDYELFSAAWESWNVGALSRIAGAFAVAMWDERQHCLTLVRDHAGEIPLFFLHQGDLLAFSTLPLPLRAIEQVDTSLDEEQMSRHLALLSGLPTQTLFRNIQRFPPGHLLTFEKGVTKVVRYWHPIDAPGTRYRRDEDYVEAFLELFDRAVSQRLPPLGKAGSELSGGMDSASVTATAAQLLGSKGLTAFTAIPQENFADGSPFGRFGNEGPAAARLSAMYPNITHVLIEPSNRELVGGLVTLEAQGFPVFNPTNHMWINAILDQCRERGLSVLLNGTCGNATLSSNGLIGLYELFSSGHWLTLIKMIYLLRQRSYTGLRRASSVATGPAIPKWLRRKLSPDEKSFSFDFSPLRRDVATKNRLREQSYEEMHEHLWSVDEYRRKTFDYFDPGPTNAAVSLNWDVERRDPTQDKRIFEFCYSIPIEQYLAGGQTRSLVRRAMRGRVPQSTLDCRDRGLQAADWYLTMGARRQEMLDELALIRLSPMANRLLDLDRLQYLLENWPTSGFETQEVIYSWHLALSRGISAGHFIRQYE